MSSALNQNAKVQLPFWMKMFANDDDKIVIADKTTGQMTLEDHASGVQSNVSEISPDSLHKIAKYLADDKIVIIMNNGTPFKIFIDDGKVKIVQLEKDAFEYK